MKIQSLSLAAGCLFVASTLSADEPVPPPPVPPPVHAIVPTPTALPSPPAALPQAREQAEFDLSQVEHLRRAAEHLEAAGATGLAREVREEADALLEASVELLHQKREQVSRLLREIAELEKSTGCHQQVMLRCRFVEVDVSKVRQLGFSWSAITADGVVEAGSLPFRFGTSDATKMNGMIDALVREGLAKVLAEPVLVTLDGQTGSFLSGGEFPVPVPDGPDKSRFEFRQYGLRLDAFPEFLGGDKVRLQIAPELSTLDYDHAVNVNDHVVPGLTMRRLNTQIEMEFGQTLTLALGHPTVIETIRQASAEGEAVEAAEIVTVICVTPERVRRVTEHPVPPPPAPPHLQTVPAH